MTEPVVLRTQRLVLRPWTEADREPFAAMGADPEVMRHFPGLLDRAASDAFVDRCMQRFTDQGWGLWVVDRGGFLGFTGLSPVPPTLPCAPAVEVGWRLARNAWGQGYATEAGRAALSYGFDVLGLDEIVSFTATLNLPSIAVMQRLGMTRDPAEDFDHPGVPVGHPVRRHVLYRLRRGNLSA
ncbi:MAG: Acetyltransferase, GNAT family [uncultured Nocardioidaceae bacterium]|uniref:Acetyltransferase, GNAT family n=1 Tax=uncultured Nocardioidaceae bacterium TaxID=253824 RepID=A0A6J4LKX1_9ACTN|nr:MAG: Acetyltransferase, GNAT family [uncultured Nocardioidaceae bacterium]